MFNAGKSPGIHVDRIPIEFLKYDLQNLFNYVQHQEVYNENRFQFNGKELDIVEEYTHLGVILNIYKKYQTEISSNNVTLCSRKGY